MSTKFNIYYATSANGPWYLANDEPLDRIEEGNEYTISGLRTNTKYYVAIVGGVVEDDEFIPYISQEVGPEAANAGDFVVVDSYPKYQVRTFAPKVPSTTKLGMQVVLGINTTSGLNMQFQSYIQTDDPLGLQFEGHVLADDQLGMQFLGGINADSQVPMQFESHILADDPLGAQFEVFFPLDFTEGFNNDGSGTAGEWFEGDDKWWIRQANPDATGLTWEASDISGGDIEDFSGGW